MAEACAGGSSTLQAVGGIGIVLYSGLLIFAIARTVLILKATSYAYHRKLFHGFVCLGAVLSIAFYASLAQSGCFTKTGYSMHILSLWADLCAYSIVIVLWSKALGMLRNRDRLHMWVIACDSLVLVYTLVVISLVIVSRSMRDFLGGQLNLSQFAVHSIVLLSYSVAMMYYGLKLQYEITSHPRWEPLRRERRLKIICRINGVLVLCTLCFLLRVSLLTGVFFRVELENSANDRDENGVIPWFVLALWTPSLVPSCLLLIVMRKGDGSSSEQNPTERVATSLKGLMDQPLVVAVSSQQPLSSRESWRPQLYAPPFVLKDGSRSAERAEGEEMEDKASLLRHMSIEEES